MAAQMPLVTSFRSFYNVLIGYMSLVLARAPPVPREVAKYLSNIVPPAAIKPGITFFLQIRPQ